MTTTRQILANRRNGTLSRGPKTPEGKARSKLNALRHGLAADRSRHVSEDVDRLAHALLAASTESGESGEALAENARVAAEAQIDLVSVRNVRVSIFNRIGTSPSAGGMNQQVMRSASDLRRLDRYERRALSKRSQAFRKLTEER